MNKIALFFTVAALSVCFAASADDDAQTELRLNPDIEESMNEALENYPFLNLSSNKITMNGADWTALRERFEAARDSGELFSVIYLGDSHIQADFGGAVLRKRLAKEASSAGRGLIIPFRLAGTNEPLDYSIQLHTPYTFSRLLKSPRATDMPFTGIAIQSDNSGARFEIAAEEPFNLVRLHFTGDNPSVAGTRDLALDRGIDFTYEDSTVILQRPTYRLLLEFENARNTVFGGFELLNGNGGVLTHSIGNNGATYSSYNSIENFGPQLANLGADLVIIALGTNEAFSAISDDVFEEQIEALTNVIKRSCPDARILLVSPTECYRRTYRRRKGRRRTSTLSVNTKTARMRDVIRRYAQKNNIAFYDTYTITGGTGAAAKMKTAKMLGSDGVHFTAGAYKVLGGLLSDAVIEALENETINNAE